VLKVFRIFFLKQNFPLNDPVVFSQVFRGTDRNQDHVLQEELSHYLDIVEVQIAKQVSQKSGAFFHAMTSHDTIMEQMGVAYNEVKSLRSKVQKVDKTLAKDSLKLIGLARSKTNHVKLVDKLKLMSTVLQTQPTLQLLLSSSDYVAALELISSTQEVLSKELAGVTSLRHLPSQLKEMSKLIDKMLSNEFERYAAADLHRPLDANGGVLEQERLISLVAGLLRQNHLQFLETYKQEAVTAAQTLLKQLLIEHLADVEDDMEHCLTGSGEVAPTMDAAHWLKVLALASDALGKLVQRVKAVHNVIKETADTSAGLRSTTSLRDTENFLTLEDHNRVEVKLKDLLISICDYCHERLASLVSTQSDKQTITATQVTELSTIVDNFTELCEKICGRQSAALRAAFKIQAGNYVNKFHSQRKNKLTMLLDAERWKVADVPQEIQILVDKLALGNTIRSLPSSPSNENSDEKKPSPALKIGAQDYTTVGTVLILIQLVCEYCVCAHNLQLLAPIVGRNLTELLRTFNSRSCQLVLGAGALKTAGLKTITTTNLALTSRSLQMVLWMIPHIRAHFNALTSDPLNGFDAIERDIGHHIQQLETKVLSIMNSLLGDQLNEWDAKPPVPSKAFRNVSRHLTKLHEAVSPVLPEEQVTDIYEVIHKNLKSRLREQLIKMNIQNNGGPQHGVVTTEIIFYLETMKTLKVLPEKYLSDKAMDDIWMR
jgi:vacuolar protein sorting-associated protein 54